MFLFIYSFFLNAYIRLNFSGSRSLERTYIGKHIYSPAMANNLKKALARHEHIMKEDKRLDLEYVKSVRYKFRKSFM